MVDVVKWLSDLELTQYSAIFAANDIDGEVLVDITDSDLQTLGVTLGHRKKLLRAIAALSGGTPNIGGQMDTTRTTVPVVPDAATQEAERRQLTVMFCDLAGSTMLSERLDPEDLRKVIRRYQIACSDVIARYEGTIAKYLGDGILVYFGYPRAHEDDAERAVRSALGIIRAIETVENGLGDPIQARIGISTGVVVVGDIIGEGAAQEQAVIGETPNLAARLQSLAPQNAVVISPATRELIGRQFRYEDLGAHEIKGFSDPVTVWQVTGERTVTTRFGATHTERLTRLIGRDQEVELLLERWNRAKSGEGQLVLLSGEAGIGKSRIAATIHERIAGEKLFAIQYQCSPHHVNSPLFPAIQHLEHSAGFTGEDTTEGKLDKLRRLLDESQVSSETVQLIAMLLSIPTSGYFTPLGLTALEQKQRTLKALTALFEQLAALRPTLFIFEDAHWIDATTREYMDLVIERAKSLRALILVTHRPEFETRWTAFANSTVLTLNRLGLNACQTIVRDLTKGRDLPLEVLEQIATRTDGIPLFVEELTKTVLESGLLTEREGKYVLAGPMAQMAIPATLKDSLMARLDRLREAKEIAQVGAAIGREFSYALIEAVSPLKGKQLDASLEALRDSEIVFSRGIPPDAIYVFKHALIQDIAYDSLLRNRRQQIHQRIAAALESSFSNEVADQPEVLAHHLSGAGALNQAAPIWLMAGQRAVARSANQEAISHLHECLGILQRLPPGSDTNNLELDAQISLGSAWIAMRGYSAIETETAYTRARALLEGLADDDRRCPVLHGLSMVYVNKAEHLRVLDVGEELLRWGNLSRDMIPRLVGHRVLAVGLNFMGRFCESRDHAEKATALYDIRLHRDTAYRFGHDMGVGAWWHLAIACTFIGDYSGAEVAAERAADLVRQLNSANTNLYGMLWDSFTRLVRGDFEGARRVAGPMVKEATRQSMALWVAFGRQLHGSALVGLGQNQAGLDEIRRGRSDAEQVTNVMLKLMALRFEVEALIRMGNVDDASDCLDEAERHIDSTAEGWWAPEIYRLRADLVRHVGGLVETGEAALRRAMHVAREHGSLLFELRAAIALGRLWQSDQRGNEVVALLAPLLDRIPTGFRCDDIGDAEMLLQHAGLTSR